MVIVIFFYTVKHFKKRSSPVRRHRWRAAKRLLTPTLARELLK
jgi:hypothetical protein